VAEACGHAAASAMRLRRARSRRVRRIESKNNKPAITRTFYIPANQTGLHHSCVTCNNGCMASRSDLRERKPTPGNERVRKHRSSLRTRGLRPVQIWIPDTRLPGFAAKARRECLALRKDAQEKDTLNFIEQAMDYSGWV
jgi:Protein  of unknown function (DUF3018)